MQRQTLVALPALALTLALAGGAAALTPGRAIVAALPVQDLALAGRSVAYVADAPDGLECARVGLWLVAVNKRLLFDAREQCTDMSSTGQGVWDVAVARQRLLWLTYTGGNFREWFLWTATPTRRTPRQLRFVSRDVDAPPPIVIGPGTAEGIPYAVDRQVTYLGDDGRAIFRWTAPEPVRAVAAGSGPRNWRVAAFLTDGTVVVLDGAGNPVYDPSFDTDHVRAVRLAREGLVVQMDRAAIVSRPSLNHVTLLLPAGAVMVDVAQGQILWTRAGDLGTTTIATGRSRRLVDGTTANPAYGQLDAKGIAWALARTVFWRAGVLP